MGWTTHACAGSVDHVQQGPCDDQQQLREKLSASFARRGVTGWGVPPGPPANRSSRGTSPTLRPGPGSRIANEERGSTNASSSAHWVAGDVVEPRSPSAIRARPPKRGRLEKGRS
jgi:hypothetical protein